MCYRTAAGPWVPQFRAAYVLQRLNDNITAGALDIASGPAHILS